LEQTSALQAKRQHAGILRAEVMGQVAYYQRHKQYVGRQREFVVQYLKNPVIALAGTY
jgi:hypothetical protein